MEIINLILLIIFECLVWTCHRAASARDTLKPGDTLNSSSSLISASGNFSFSFYVYNDGSKNTSYISIQRNKANGNIAWIGNREAPILYPPSAFLTLDRNNTLKIMRQGGDPNPIVIFSARQTTRSTNISNSNDTVVAILLDSGNFVLQEVNSVDRSPEQVLWQSFDYPVDTLLSGMKLGVNRTNGHVWSISSWETEENPVPGPFTLDWDPTDHQLKIKKGEVVYWTSGAFTSSTNTFEYILPEESKLWFNFSIVSNENEDYLTYTALDLDQDSEWVLNNLGRLGNLNFEIAQAGNCDGYNTGGGCTRRDRPPNCMAKFGDEFEVKNGFFIPSNISSRSPYWFTSSSSDCKATCWQNCDCVGFDFPLDDNTNTSTGCRFWSADSKFVEDFAGSGTANSSFALPRLITPSKSPLRKDNTANKWIWIGTSIAIALVLCIVFYLLRRRRLALSAGENITKIQNELLNFMRPNRVTHLAHGIQNDGKMEHHDLSAFSYTSVLAATCNFSEENKLGQGGYGPVYKGKLVTGQEIAVKRLSKCSGQGTSEFKNELILIYELQHTNLVRLFGFCIHEEERMLIYEYMPNKSLDYFLFDSTRGLLLDWKKRYGIIEGITQGLLYLHKYSRTKVIHRDLKASNILLDENMNPKISDFGMARIFTENELEGNTSRVVGTRGYMPPESIEGIVSVKSDVYGFGVLMLEIISGRKNSSFYNDDHAINLVGHAWESWKDGAALELIDPILIGDSCIADQVLRCIHVGLLCVEEDAADRPTMSDVISMLTNESSPLAFPTKPAFFVGRKMAGAGTSGNQQLEIASVNDMSNSDFGAR
ncbi:hypothetical protein ACFX2G_004348 [Malus domestica]